MRTKSFGLRAVAGTGRGKEEGDGEGEGRGSGRGRSSALRALNPNLFGTKSLAGRGEFRRRINSQRNITAAVAEAQRRPLGSQLERLQRNCFRRAAAPQELLQKSCCRELFQRSRLRRAAPEELRCRRGNPTGQTGHSGRRS